MYTVYEIEVCGGEKLGSKKGSVAVDTKSKAFKKIIESYLKPYATTVTFGDLVKEIGLPVLDRVYIKSLLDFFGKTN
jgi:hypothetical protein